MSNCYIALHDDICQCSKVYDAASVTAARYRDRRLRAPYTTTTHYTVPPGSSLGTFFVLTLGLMITSYTTHSAPALSLSTLGGPTLMGIFSPSTCMTHSEHAVYRSKSHQQVASQNSKKCCESVALRYYAAKTRRTRCSKDSVSASH